MSAAAGTVKALLNVVAVPSIVAVITLSVVGLPDDAALASDEAFWDATSAEDASANRALFIDPMRAMTGEPVWSKN